MLAPLFDLVGECGEMKATRKNKVIKKPWHWDPIHQTAFDNVKTTIAKDVVLAYQTSRSLLIKLLIPVCAQFHYA
jgi:hypothetical protein